MDRFKHTFSVLLTATLVSGCQTSPVPDSARLQTVSIEEARTRSIGEEVRVSGIVTVQSGAFASSMSSGFALQDESAGIYVLDSSHEFKLGDKVQVTGIRGAEFDQTNIILESAEPLARSGLIVPKRLETGHVDETEEGLLVQVEGRITRLKDDAPYGYKIFIDDGSGEIQVFIDASTALIGSAADWEVGDFISVTGFSGQYEETYEVLPRIAPDIKKQAAQDQE